MKKVLSLTIFLGILISVSFAGIVRGTIGNGTYTDYSSSSSTAYGLDFNNDGQIDFKITTGSWNNMALEYYNGLTGDYTSNNIVGGDDPTILSVGTSISASSNWAGYGDASIGGWGETPSCPIGEPFYLGFRIKIGTNFHYGWAKMQVVNNAGSYSATWLDCCYESTPNTAINVGETPNTAIVEANNTNVKIYPNPVKNRLQIASNNVKRIEVLNVLGNVVETVEGGNNVNFANLQKGIYVVRITFSNNKTTLRKVVKK